MCRVVLFCIRVDAVLVCKFLTASDIKWQVVEMLVTIFVTVLGVVISLGLEL